MIILTKVMLKQKNANGECHLCAIIFNTLLHSNIWLTHQSKNNSLTLKEEDDVLTQLFH